MSLQCKITDLADLSRKICCSLSIWKSETKSWKWKMFCLTGSFSGFSLYRMLRLEATESYFSDPVNGIVWYPWSHVLFMDVFFWFMLGLFRFLFWWGEKCLENGLYCLRFTWFEPLRTGFSKLRNGIQSPLVLENFFLLINFLFDYFDGNCSFYMVIRDF